MLSNGISFNITKKVKPTILENTPIASSSKYDEKQDIAQKNKKRSAKNLVIPLPTTDESKKRLLNSSENGAANSENIIESKTSDFLQLLMAKKEKNLKKDLESLPDTNEDDVDEVPIEGFGLACLRGMGYKDGDKSTEVREVVLRPRGLGLGCKVSTSGKIVSTDAHRNGNADDDANGYGDDDDDVVKGDFCRINFGKYKDICGEVMGMDDCDRVLVKLSPNNEVISLIRPTLCKISKKKFNAYLDSLSSGQKNHSNNDNTKTISEPKPVTITSSSSKSHNNFNTDNKQSSSKLARTHWLRPNIIVRIISQSYKKGKYFKEKVVVDDVTTPTTCTCRTDKNVLLEDLHESMLETVIPKQLQTKVMILQGSNKGQFAMLMKKDKDKEKAVVYLLDDISQVLTLSYYDICQCTTS